MVAGVTHYCSVVAMATTETYHRFGFPVVVWGAVLPDITYGHDFKEIHRVNGTMINQNETAAKFMLGRGYRKWAVIHDTTDYGKGHNKYFSQYVKAGGGQIVATFGVTADQQDFTAELTQIKAHNPEVVYFGGLTPIGVRIRAQMDKLGIAAQFEGTSGVVSDDFIRGRPKGWWPSARGRTPRSCPAGGSSWRSTRSRSTRRARRPTAPSPSPRPASSWTSSRRWARIARR
jgi:branched-chain amino acid transport system substrate-binding protein